MIKRTEDRKKFYQLIMAKMFKLSMQTNSCFTSKLQITDKFLKIVGRVQHQIGLNLMVGAHLFVLV